MNAIKKIVILCVCFGVLLSNPIFSDSFVDNWHQGIVQKIVLTDRFVVINSIRYYVPRDFSFRTQESINIPLSALNRGQKLYFSSEKIKKTSESPLYLYQLKQAYILPDDYILSDG